MIMSGSTGKTVAFTRHFARSRAARLLAATCAVTTLACPVVEGAPYRPTDDRAVLERLPTRPTDPVQRELRELRKAHEAAPGNAGPAVDLARRYFSLALETGDLRYVGYAEAALSSWRR